METTTFSAPDIVCDGCASAIKKALGAVPGVSLVAVNVDAKQVTVDYAPPAERNTIAAALERAGFPVEA